MKAITLSILCLCCLIAAQALQAQEPRPSWADNAPVASPDANYVYVSGMGIGSNEEQAVSKAWANALKKAMHTGGLVDFDRQSLSAKELEGEIVPNKLARNLKCQTSAIHTESGMVKVYVLLQVKKRAAEATNFAEQRFIDCNPADFERNMKKWEYGDYGFSPRVFVPGMAQLHKGSKAKGIFFIAGEVALIGGVVLAENLRASYTAKINATHSASEKKTYISSADNWGNVRNGFIAGAAALYAWNVIDGWAAKGKRHVLIGSSSLRVAPYMTPEAGGVSFALNF